MNHVNDIRGSLGFPPNSLSSQMISQWESKLVVTGKMLAMLTLL